MNALRWRHLDGIDRQRLADALAGSDAQTTLKLDGSARVLCVHAEGLDLVVKVRRVGATDRLKYSVRGSRADRQRRGARRALACGVDAAVPVAIGTARDDGACVEVVVMKRVDGKTLLELLAEGEPASLREAASVVGAMTARLALGGFANRDHKPSNIIVGRDGDGETRATLIDTVAVRPVRPRVQSDVWRMLAALVIEPIGCGCRPSRTMMMRTLCGFLDAFDARRAGQGRNPIPNRSVVVRRIWNGVDAIVSAHGDPTPDVNPLRSADAGGTGHQVPGT